MSFSLSTMSTMMDQILLGRYAPMMHNDREMRTDSFQSSRQLVCELMRGRNTPVGGMDREVPTTLCLVSTTSKKCMMQPA